MSWYITNKKLVLHGKRVLIFRILHPKRPETNKQTNKQTNIKKGKTKEKNTAFLEVLVTKDKIVIALTACYCIGCNFEPCRNGLP